MAWSGGTYSKGNSATGGWTGDASLGIGIEAGRHDTQDNDFASGINNCIAKDGQNAATADLPMGGFKHTNVANASARNNYAAVGQVQDGDFIWLGTTGGTATAQTATATPAITAYKAGQKFRMKIGAGLDSTGISATTVHTLNVNSIGAKNIVNQDATNLTRGTFLAGYILEVVYDGTNFVIINDAGGWSDYSTTLSVNAGTQTSVVYNSVKYRKIGKQIFLQVSISWTQSVASFSYVDIILPVQPTKTDQLLRSDHTITGRAYVNSLVGAGTARSWAYNNGLMATGSQFVLLAGDYVSI